MIRLLPAVWCQNPRRTLLSGRGVFRGGQGERDEERDREWKVVGAELALEREREPRHHFCPLWPVILQTYRPLTRRVSDPDLDTGVAAASAR